MKQHIIYQETSKHLVCDNPNNSEAWKTKHKKVKKVSDIKSKKGLWHLSMVQFESKWQMLVLGTSG